MYKYLAEMLKLQKTILHKQYLIFYFPILKTKHIISYVKLYIKLIFVFSILYHIK